MKPFEELSYLGRIRRMRQSAQAALNAYGLSNVRFKFLRQAGNTLFRVNEANPTLTTKPELYTQGQYMLRIHQPGYQTTEAIELELLGLPPCVGTPICQCQNPSQHWMGSCWHRFPSLGYQGNATAPFSGGLRDVQ